MGRWGDGEMGRWGDGKFLETRETWENLVHLITSYLLLNQGWGDGKKIQIKNTIN